MEISTAPWRKPTWSYPDTIHGEVLIVCAGKRMDKENMSLI